MRFRSLLKREIRPTNMVGLMEDEIRKGRDSFDGAQEGRRTLCHDVGGRFQSSTTCQRL